LRRPLRFLAEFSIEVTSDLMLNAAVVGEFNDGAAATTGGRPSNHACMADVTTGQGFGEDARESREERSFSMTRKTMAVPITAAPADHLLQFLVKMLTVAGIPHRVDVGDLLRAMVWRVHNESATCTAAMAKGFPGAGIVEVNVCRGDAFNTSTSLRSPAPNLVSAPCPATSQLRIGAVSNVLRSFFRRCGTAKL